MKSLGPSITAGMQWDMQFSTPLPAGAFSPEMLSAPGTWEAVPLTLPMEPQLSPEWPSDRKLYLGIGGCPQEARAYKIYCPKAYGVISLFSFDFMAAATMLDARALAIP